MMMTFSMQMVYQKIAFINVIHLHVCTPLMANTIAAVHASVEETIAALHAPTH